MKLQSWIHGYTMVTIAKHTLLSTSHQRWTCSFFYSRFLDSVETLCLSNRRIRRLCLLLECFKFSRSQSYSIASFRCDPLTTSRLKVTDSPTSQSSQVHYSVYSRQVHFPI